MEQIHITINGKDYSVNENLTILEAAEQTKSAKIPTLCYEKKLGHINSCYLCVVEVKGAKTLMSACSTKITAGMSIETDSPAVIAARKECLSLLLSDHYADCYSPCRKECPAGVDIQGYLKLANEGYNKEAVELIKQANPLPIVCGRVCVRPCELKCRRELVDSSIAIDAVKRAVSESSDGLSDTTKIKSNNNKKTAVIGSGPAGLSFAYYALKEGFSVTLFEAMPKGGGMLRYGIPSYRLPKELLDIEIKKIADMGAEFKYNTKIGTDEFEEIKSKFDYLFIANGAWKASGAGIENESDSCVVSGLDFLREAYTGELKKIEGLNVSVIGGGNTAIDAARTAVRLGAAEVTIIYRRSEAEMPAHHEEIEAAKKEGVKLLLLTAPKKISSDGLECICMELGEPDASGRRRPQEVKGSEFIRKTDLVITAVGQGVELNFLPKLMLTDRGRVNADNLTFKTVEQNIYVGGDCLTGPATVIEAIASGRKAIENICRKQKTEFMTAKEMFGKIEPDSIVQIPKANKMQMAEKAPDERIKNFKETEFNLLNKQLMAESSRCLACGCSATDYCLLKRYSENYDITNFTQGSREIKRPDISHPYIILDSAKCIKCQRCIKTCENINGRSILGLKDRGFVTSIVPSGDIPLSETNCTSCGNCVDSCPTGAITAKDDYFAFADELKITNCILCSALCKIGIKSFGRYIKTTSARRKTDGEGEYVCRYGRFEINNLFGKNRLTKAYINKYEVDFEVACKKIADNFKEIATKYGSESIGIFLSPMLSSETVYASVKLAKGIIGTENVFSLKYYNEHLQPINLNNISSTATLCELKKADIIILVGDNPEKFVPALNWEIRDAVKNGAELLITSPLTALTDIAVKTIKQIDAEYITKDNQTKIIAVCTPDIEENQLNDILKLLKITGNSCGEGRGLLIAQDGANIQGLQKWGAVPNYLPGFSSFKNEKDLEFFKELWGENNLQQRNMLKTEEIRSALFIGENPDIDYLKTNFNNIEFISVCSGDFTIYADVIIPFVSILETGGHITPFKEEEIKIPPAITPCFEFSPLDMLNQIAEIYSGKQLNASEDMKIINSQKENKINGI